MGLADSETIELLHTNPTTPFEVVAQWRMKYGGGIMNLVTLQFEDGTQVRFRQDSIWKSKYKNKPEQEVFDGMKQSIVRLATKGMLVWH